MSICIRRTPPPCDRETRARFEEEASTLAEKPHHAEREESTKDEWTPDAENRAEPSNSKRCPITKTCELDGIAGIRLREERAPAKRSAKRCL